MRYLNERIIELDYRRGLDWYDDHHPRNATDGNQNTMFKTVCTDSGEDDKAYWQC